MNDLKFKGVINATIPVEGTSNGIKLSGNVVLNSSLKVTNADGQFINVEKNESIGSFNMYDGRMDYHFSDYSKSIDCISAFNDLLASIDLKTKDGLMITVDFPAKESEKDQ